MIYRTEDKVQAEAKISMHKIMFQKIKKICKSGKPGWIVLNESENGLTSCFTEDFDVIEKRLDFANSHMASGGERSSLVSVD